MSNALGVSSEVVELSLKDMAKRSIIDDMLEIVKQKMAQSEAASSDLEKGEDAGKSYIALIVDSHTLRIISGACRQYDIQERGVTVVEQIEKIRQPLSDLDAVYFLSPTETSIELLLKDHKGGNALYRYSHVFFSGPLNEKFFDILAKEEYFVNRCYSFYELNIEYVSFEPRVFHCDKPLSIRYLRGTDANALLPIVRRHINCLVSVCASLKERPVIRYMARSTVSNLSEKIALGFKREIDLLANSMDRIHKPFKNRGTTFLIVDRSIESAGLLVHEYSYQALALDVLDGMTPNGVRWGLGLDDKTSIDGNMSVLPAFSYSSVSAKGETEVKNVVLGDHDDLWRKFRHVHVKDVSEITTLEVRDFSKNHTLAKLQKSSSDRRGSETDPMELLRGLPEYQDILSKYSLHIELSKACFDALERFKLFEVGKIEQELATGVDDDGKDISCIKVFQSLTSLLQSGRIGSEEKLRLVALYLSQVNDVNESSAQTLVRTAAALSVENESVVKQFLGLGIHGTRAATAGDKPGTNRHTHKADKNSLKKNKSRAKGSAYVNCRFVPKLKDIVESALTNTMDTQEYPLVGGAGASVYSVGSGGASPDGKRKSAAALWGHAMDGEIAKDEAARQKLVVFVIGGITLAETRAMQELEVQFACDILIGGSTILTPKRLVEILQVPL